MEKVIFIEGNNSQETQRKINDWLAQNRSKEIISRQLLYDDKNKKIVIVIFYIQEIV